LTKSLIGLVFPVAIMQSRAANAKQEESHPECFSPSVVSFLSRASAFFAPAHPFPPGTDIGDVLTAHPESYKFSLGHVQDLTIESFGMFRMLLLEFGAAVCSEPVSTGLSAVAVSCSKPNHKALVDAEQDCDHQSHPHSDVLAGNFVEESGSGDSKGVPTRSDDCDLSRL
jgi:hypothetical protein